MTPSSNDPAEARKRRKEIIQSQRSENEAIANGVSGFSNGISAASGTNENTGENAGSSAVLNDADDNGVDKKPPKKRKLTDSSARKNDKKTDKPKKTQIRYDPEVPMNKDQLAAWRREARRVRNRESAAASRQRIRNRISELEDEVGDWKAKYAVAIQRLEALEKCITANNNGAASQQDLEPDPPSAQQEPSNQPEEQPAGAGTEGTEVKAEQVVV